MSKSKTRLGLVGLCVTAAMAMMAFAASGAQAASWMVGEETVTANLLVTIVVTVHPPLTLHTFASGSNVLITCENAEVEENKEAQMATLKAEGKASGKVLFTECSTELNGSPSAPCKPNEPIVAGGTLEVTKHEGATDIKGTGAAGKFTTVTFGEECSIGEEFDVTGTAWIKDSNGEAEVENTTHKIEEDTAAAEALGGLKFGEEPANITGSVLVKVFEGGVLLAFWVLG